MTLSTQLPPPDQYESWEASKAEWPGVARDLVNSAKGLLYVEFFFTKKKVFWGGSLIAILLV